MADRDCTRLSWPSKPSSSPEIEVNIRGVPFAINKKFLAAKSDKLAALLKDYSHEEISSFLSEISADPDTFELVARFCYGYELKFSNENIVPLIYLAVSLEMSENRSTNNLIRQAVNFFREKILPSWNETIKTLLHMEKFGKQSEILGLTSACIESIVSKIMANPYFLRKPIRNPDSDDSIENDEDEYRPSTRRKLFAHDCQLEDLTILPLKHYELIIGALNLQGAPPEFIASSLCQYAKRWIYSRGENVSVYARNPQREVIEAVQRHLPNEYGLLPCALLFQMLGISNELEASSECSDGFEVRIGKQLDQATVEDLLIPFHGYARETKYDISCVKRILKHFYNSCTRDREDTSGFMRVAILIEDFLAELANEEDLEATTFISLTEMLAAASLGNRHDGLYRAIDIYLDKHKSLTESEKEKVCCMLDCQKMSPAACEHAAQNERLPLRVAVRALFFEQLRLRDAVTQEVHGFEDLTRNAEEEEEEEVEARGGCSEERLISEMERMNSKVLKLEKECCIMRKEIEHGCNHKKAKVSMWGEIKRKFGCISSTHDCDCHVKKKKKKVHPRHGWI